MMITESSKQVIPFGPQDAKRVGEGCFYVDLIVWLNGNQIELGERVGFNYGCYVNGYGGLRIGHRTIVGPYTMIHTANHQMSTERPIVPPAPAEFSISSHVRSLVRSSTCSRAGTTRFRPASNPAPRWEPTWKTTPSASIAHAASMVDRIVSTLFW